MELYDIAVTPDSQRLVVIGTFLGRTNAQPSLSRREKRIIGTVSFTYFIASRLIPNTSTSVRHGTKADRAVSTIHFFRLSCSRNVGGFSQAPLLQDVQNVTMARNGKVVLVSYGNKVAPLSSKPSSFSLHLSHHRPHLSCGLWRSTTPMFLLAFGCGTPTCPRLPSTPSVQATSVGRTTS